MNHTVKVIIPIYKESLKDWERASLENTMRVLSAYPIVFLTPPPTENPLFNSNLSDC